MSKKHEPEQKNSNDQLPTVGQQLRLAREQANLSIDHVANKLYLARSVINDIESDKALLNTSIVFNKGYVKSYSVFLNLSTDEILKCFDKQYQVNSDINKMQTFSNRTKNTTHNSYLNWVTIIVIVTMIIGLSVWWWQQQNEEIIAVESVTNSTLVNNEPSPRLPLIPNIDSAVEDDESLMIETTFTFSRDCWVRVVDATNAVIAVGIKKGGTSIDIAGVAPLKVILGAPNAVKITYLQETLDITSYIVKDTATFTLPLGK